VKTPRLVVAGAGLLLASAIGSSAQTAAPGAPPDVARTLVSRLDLEKYKATIKGLTAFGDRRQGTDRNRAAIDWIEAQLKSYGCANIERVVYEYAPQPRPAAGEGGTPAARAPRAGGLAPKGLRGPTGVNNDPARQPDAKLRELNMGPTTPGRREEVYCTKIGTIHPEEMYIVGGHMDGLGYAEAANDNGSGAAIVMELARIFSAPDVKTERSIRFILWNNEETVSTAPGRTSSSVRISRARKTRRARGSTRNRSGSG